MKIKLLLIIASITFFTACDKRNEPEIIDPNKIKLNEVVHDTLTSEQLKKITKIHSTFAGVDTSSLENVITDFKRDLNPDNEIEIWLQMANAYESYMKGKSKTLEQKKEIYKLILSRSMMSSEEVLKNLELKEISRPEAIEILSHYRENPIPIRVYEK